MLGVVDVVDTDILIKSLNPALVGVRERIAYIDGGRG
jgi:hypothetical protein